MMGVIISFMMFMFVYVFTYPKFKADQVMPAFVWGGIRGCDVVVYLSYQEPSGWKISGMADLFYAPGDAIPAHIVWEC